MLTIHSLQLQLLAWLRPVIITTITAHTLNLSPISTACQWNLVDDLIVWLSLSTMH